MPTKTYITSNKVSAFKTMWLICCRRQGSRRLVVVVESSSRVTRRRVITVVHSQPWLWGKAGKTQSQAVHVFTCRWELAVHHHRLLEISSVDDLARLAFRRSYRSGNFPKAGLTVIIRPPTKHVQLV
ncbi:unnamed protein product [Calypogeia fissa]